MNEKDNLMKMLRGDMPDWLPFDGCVNFERVAEHFRNSPFEGTLMLEVSSRHETYANMTADEEYPGGADSNLCEAVDAAVTGGFDHITVVTDGHQWPAEYSALGVYSDVDVEILLTEEIDVNEERFLDALEGSLSTSSLKVETLTGEEKVLLDGYHPTTIMVEMEVPEVEPGDSDVGTSSGAEESTTEEVEATCNHKKCPCLWWLALVLAVIIAALFDLIHELITRKRGKEEKGEEQQPVAQQPQQAVPCTCQQTFPCRECPFEEWQMEQAVIGKLQNGANLLLDTSGSMTSLRKVATAAAKKVAAENLIAFAENVEQVEASALDAIQLGGSTHGWEAVELAEAQGYDELVIVSDLAFNGKSFAEMQLQGKFQKITAVVPKKGYRAESLEQLQQIADKVDIYQGSFAYKPNIPLVYNSGGYDEVGNIQKDLFDIYEENPNFYRRWNCWSIDCFSNTLFAKRETELLSK